MPDIKRSYTGEGDGKTVTVMISEETVGLNNFNTLNDFIAGEMSAGLRSFSFDLTDLKTINSSGLGILISGLKRIKDAGGKLNIINANEKILGILKLTKLDNVFHIG